MNDAVELICPGCGYDRRGIAADACPECGLSTTEADTALFRAHQLVRRTRRRRLLVLVVLATVPALGLHLLGGVGILASFIPGLVPLALLLGLGFLFCLHPDRGATLALVAAWQLAAPALYGSLTGALGSVGVLASWGGPKWVLLSVPFVFTWIIAMQLVWYVIFRGVLTRSGLRSRYDLEPLWLSGGVVSIGIGVLHTGMTLSLIFGQSAFAD